MKLFSKLLQLCKSSNTKKNGENWCRYEKRYCPSMYETYGGSCYVNNRCSQMMISEKVRDIVLEIDNNE